MAGMLMIVVVPLPLCDLFDIHQWQRIYNLIGVPVAAGVLYPAVGILLSPMLAALARSFSSVSVIANALRLRRLRL